MNSKPLIVMFALFLPVPSQSQEVRTIEFYGFDATCRDLTKPEGKASHMAHGSCTSSLFSIEYKMVQAPDWFSHGQDNIALLLRLIDDRSTAGIQKMVSDIEIPAPLPWRRDEPPKPLILPTSAAGFCAVGLVEPPIAFPTITAEENLNPLAVRCFVESAGLMLTLDFFPTDDFELADVSLLQAAAMSTTVRLAN